MADTAPGLMAQLDGFEGTDEDRAYILARALLTRAGRARARAGALVAGTPGAGSARLRRLAGAAMALAEAGEALGAAERLARLLGAAT